MNAEQNIILSNSTILNPALDKPGMATLKALSILLTPVYMQWRQSKEEIKNDFKLPSSQLKGASHQIIDVVESASDEASLAEHQDEEAKPILSKNQGMIYHLKHTKNTVSLN